MIRYLRNLSIHAAMVLVLALFVVATAAIATLAIVAERSAMQAMATLDQINVQQLNEINRADAQLSRARVRMAAAVNDLLMARQAEATQALAAASEQMARAEANFASYAAVPRTEQGKALGTYVFNKKPLICARLLTTDAGKVEQSIKERGLV